MSEGNVRPQMYVTTTVCHKLILNAMLHFRVILSNNVTVFLFCDGYLNLQLSRMTSDNLCVYLCWSVAHTLGRCSVDQGIAWWPLWIHQTVLCRPLSLVFPWYKILGHTLNPLVQSVGCPHWWCWVYSLRKQRLTLGQASLTDTFIKTLDDFWHWTSRRFYCGLSLIVHSQVHSHVIVSVCLLVSIFCCLSVVGLSSQQVQERNPDVSFYSNNFQVVLGFNTRGTCPEQL